jgi:archaeal type IV pilus assembly protein PilA
MKHTEDTAVSPVIGVILMVAITVILAAVIAAFVFNMAGEIHRSYTVGATVNQPAQDKIIVTYYGGQDARQLTSINVTINDLVQAPIDTPLNADGSLKVGTSRTFTGTFNNNGPNHVIVVGNFLDGRQQIITDAQV